MRHGAIEKHVETETETESGVVTIERATRLATLVLQLGLCAFVVALWIAGKPPLLSVGTNKTAPAEEMVAGTAKRPYVLRVLTPMLVRHAVGIVPKETRDRFSTDLHERNVRVRKLVALYGMDKLFLPEFAVLVCINLAAVWGFMLSVEYLFKALFETRGFAPEVGSAIAVLLLPPFFRVGAHFIYDLCSLAFFAAALLFLCRQRWVPFYLSIAFGFLNKETQSMIVIPFAVYMWNRLPRRRFWIHLGAQAALFIVLRGLLLLFYDPDRPTRFFDNFLRDYFAHNLVLIWKSRLLYDWTWIAALAVVVILVLRHFRARPLLLRAGTLVSVPLFAGFLKGGLWGEIRVFYEVYPVFFLLAYVSALEFIGIDVRARASERGERILPNRLSAEVLWIILATSIGVVAMGTVYLGLGDRF